MAAVKPAGPDPTITSFSEEVFAMEFNLPLKPSYCPDGLALGFTDALGLGDTLAFGLAVGLTEALAEGVADGLADGEALTSGLGEGDIVSITSGVTGG